MTAGVGNVTTISNTQAVTHTGAHNNNGDVVVVLISADTGNSISGTPTYGGDNLTATSESPVSDGGRKSWIYYILAPKSGSNFVSVTFTGSTFARVRAFSITNADTTGIGAHGGASGTGTGASKALSSSADSVILGNLCLDNSGGDPGNITPGSGDTESDDVSISSTTNKAWSGYTSGTGGSVTLSASWTPSESYAFAVLEILSGATLYTQDVGGAVSFAGAASKSTSKSFSGVLDFSGSMLALRIFFQTVGGALSFAGNLTKVIEKHIAGTLSFSGSLISIVISVIRAVISFVKSPKADVDFDHSPDSSVSFIESPDADVDME